MASRNNPINRRDDIVIQQSKGEILIYDLKLNRALCLNETSALVWRLCDGTKSVEEISQAISKKLKTPVSEDLVFLALDQLKKENLLSNGAEIKFKFDGLSRREAIRKVGFAAMIALPVITSLVAPRAVDAQSVACGGACTCSVGNITSQAPSLCRAVLNGTSNCPDRSTCDCLVVAGIGSTGGRCQGT